MIPERIVSRFLDWLWTGSEGRRIWALGVVKARPEFATTRVILEALQRPDDMFDLYHALLAARRAAAIMRRWQQERIRDAVMQLQESKAFGSDRDCINAAEVLVREGEQPIETSNTRVMVVTAGPRSR
jgi:hypothetical protein